MKEKIPWHGVLISVQPRIRLSRSFDQRSHTYLGYTLKVRGSVATEAREFLLGVGQGAHAKHQFRAGDTVSGDALPVVDPRLETVEFYKVGKRLVMESANCKFIAATQRAVNWTIGSRSGKPEL